MKIATWNIERPTKTSKRLPLIMEQLKQIDADILILTETNEAIDLSDIYTTFHTSTLTDTFYKAGEKRVSIYSKYKSSGLMKTFREGTSICVTLQTPLGGLSVYGTIIGINGSKRQSFTDDLSEQLIDFDNIATANNNFCIAGDLNISFGDNYYFTKDGREKLNASFNKLNMINLTSHVPNNIDHIIVSKTFISERNYKIETWNNPPDIKKFSDHLGVAVTIG